MSGDDQQQANRRENAALGHRDRGIGKVVGWTGSRSSCHLLLGGAAGLLVVRGVVTRIIRWSHRWLGGRLGRGGNFLGRSGLLYVSLIFAILHIGYRSAADFLFVLAIALLYGWVVRRTGSIIGVSVSHGITNITLFLVIPFIPVLAAKPDWLPLVT